MHEVAIGPNTSEANIHLSARDDSSSLLPISELQAKIFPGTEEVGIVPVNVTTLEKIVNKNDISGISLLKLDVQGFELQALEGCKSLLHLFKWVYCECSFVELYSEQNLASDVICWMNRNKFVIDGIFNQIYTREGSIVQADFMFRNIMK